MDSVPDKAAESSEVKSKDRPTNRVRPSALSSRHESIEAFFAEYTAEAEEQREREERQKKKREKRSMKRRVFDFVITVVIGVVLALLLTQFVIQRNTVIESFLISALAMTRESILIDDLLTMTDGTSISREEMYVRLRKSAEVTRAEGASLKLELHNLQEDQRAQIVQIPDFAVEILFLSIFSLLASLMIADPATQQRLRSIDGGPLRDYLSSLIALAIAGVIQLSLMAGLTELIIPGVNRPDGYWLVMAVFLLLMLAFGQLVSLMPSEQRFVPASLVLFIFALIGGTFIRLPSAFVDRIGQYTPHGWAFARLSGMPTTLPLLAVAGIGFALLILSYVLQTRCHCLMK
jgi:F0F1-type ATP synthase assembly protein I